jgi:cell division protein YceG involved in septum cleavage
MFGINVWFWGRVMKRRRRAERHKFLVISIVTLCLVFILGLTCGSFLSKAKGKDRNVSGQKRYTSVQIQSGDTLWELADTYGDSVYASKSAYIKEVIRINSLSSEDCIISGQYLILPYYTEEHFP